MAKAKSKGKKQTSNSNKNNKKPILIVAIILGVILIYGIYQTSKFTTFKPKNAFSEYSTTKKTEKKSPQKVEKEETAKEVSKPTQIEPEVSLVESKETNKDLPSYSYEDDNYFSSSFDFHWPAYSQKDQIIEHEYYTLKYNERNEQADWVAYKLTGENLEQAKYKRKDNFKPDPDVKSESAHPNDYKGSGYDRGHLAPAADFTWTEDGLDETFYMSNMSPQVPGFNRGIWKKLEAEVRSWATENNVVYVVTGPVYVEKSDKIGKNKVAVPDKYYKVVLELDGTEKKGIAFILDNEKSSMPLSEFAMSIDDAERILGMDFFPAMPDNLENEIEKSYSFSAW